ncbi:MAG: aspartyl/glutamyl-tRNA amidotransferase subunit C [Spirochaetaceae bacterium]|jgi:aspartyl-tRNA(Asn)/glutamyl-tRNA(Gln) amidotransferase subunit C|nr:aspartyl/glutamyl-tRNA amidotransferase subunit C [Spirochaetaceae bacterium]
MDIEELKITAELARLKISNDELQSSFGAFEQMLEYFAEMQDADTLFKLSGAESGRAAPLERFRSDSHEHIPPQCTPESMLHNAGEHDGRFVVVPNVL